jgi:geranylgeranyl transferase type-2 subunit beta
MNHEPDKPLAASQLVETLVAGAAALPEELRRRHAAYLAAMQADDGGFPGRRGASDCYYTAFGLAGLMLLGELTPERADRAARFLAARLAGPLGGVDFVAAVVAGATVEAAGAADPFASAGIDRAAALRAAVEPLRRGDGGYAKTPRGAASSTYQTFLTVVACQVAGLPADEPARIVEMIRSRQRGDGGFVELDAMRRSGTNPTAAAVGLLAILGALDETTTARAARFLDSMQTAQGGLRANTQIPIADLLSTFTGAAALGALGAAGAIDAPRARRFAAALECPSGGFRGGPWDEQADVEYTFYGLGALALFGPGDSAP